MAVPQCDRKWTYEDLCSLPDGKRYEIIGGQLYELPSANWDHGQVIMNLIWLLQPIARRTEGNLHTAPQAVFMPDADPVQPDLVLLTVDQKGLISSRGVEGAPALVIEVLSPSNPEHDRIRKRALYARGGVREYWIVSPEAATVEVLVLEGGAYRTHLRAGGDEPVTSPLLPDLAFPASRIFQ